MKVTVKIEEKTIPETATIPSRCNVLFCGNKPEFAITIGIAKTGQTWITAVCAIHFQHACIDAEWANHMIKNHLLINIPFSLI
jgi:hypothetical protein